MPQVLFGSSSNTFGTNSRVPSNGTSGGNGHNGAENGQSRNVTLDLALYLEDISANLLLLGAHQKIL